MDYTIATVIIAEEDKVQAQTDIGAGFFTAPLSSTGMLPATHFVSTGHFYNSELDKICNTTTWPKKVYFGPNYEAALQSENLKLIQSTEIQNEN